MSFRLLAGCTLLALTLGGLQAQDPSQPLLRVRLEPSTGVLVGQPVRVYVDVLVSTWLMGAPGLPDLDIHGAITLLSDERALNLTESIEGRSWFGVRRSYLVYPQEPGVYELPPAAVEVRYAVDARRTTVSVPLPGASFEATIPGEAAGLEYFFATTRLDIQQSLEPNNLDLKVGDSLTRTVSVTARGTFPMFLPPLSFLAPEGLSVYPDPPRVQELRTDRNQFTGGKRTERVTYFIEEEGSYALPELSISWWDLNAGRLRESVLPPVEFVAQPNPEYRSEMAPAVMEEVVEEQVTTRTFWDRVPSRWRVYLAAVAGLVVIGLVLLRAPRVLAELRRRRETYRDSETALFRRFRRAALSNRPKPALKSLLLWVDRCFVQSGVRTLESLAVEAGDPELEKEIGVLQRTLFAREAKTDEQTGWNGRRLYRQVTIARKKLLKKTRAQSLEPGSLPPLNPRA